MTTQTEPLRHAVLAEEHQVNRPRQRASSHQAKCPTCGREIFFNNGPSEATLFGGCVHFIELVQTGNQIAVVFQGVN